MSVTMVRLAAAGCAARALFALWLCAAPVHAWEAGSDGLMPIPPLRERVTDLTSTLAPADAQALNAKLAAWEQQTGNQLAVLIVPTTKPEPIEAYAIRVADAWKIGRKGQDNGALLVVAKDDKKLRIEVGYGLEGVLTDATSRRIIAETIAPFLRQNQFAQGINAGVDQIIGVVTKGEPMAAKPAAKPQARSGGGFPIEMLLIIVFVVVPVLGSVLRRDLRQGDRARRSAPASSARARGSSRGRPRRGDRGRRRAPGHAVRRGRQRSHAARRRRLGPAAAAAGAAVAVVAADSRAAAAASAAAARPGGWD